MKFFNWINPYEIKIKRNSTIKSLVKLIPFFIQIATSIVNLEVKIEICY